MSLPDPTKMAAVLAQLPDADIAAIDAVADVMEAGEYDLEEAVQEQLAHACIDWPEDAEVAAIDIAVAILRGASEAIKAAKAHVGELEGAPS